MTWTTTFPLVKSKCSIGGGVVLEIQNVRHRSKGALPERENQGCVDVAMHEANPGFVERERSVHLDVRLSNRRPSLESVDCRDEGEGAPRQESVLPEQVKPMSSWVRPTCFIASEVTG